MRNQDPLISLIDRLGGDRLSDRQATGMAVILFVIGLVGAALI